jgi:hypothetical protein
MAEEFRWSVEDFLRDRPLHMILEGLGSICATPLQLRDGEGRARTVGPGPAPRDSAPILSPIRYRGRDVGEVAGWSAGGEEERVSMTVALAASLVSQFLRSSHEVRNLADAVSRRHQGLEVLARMDGELPTREEEARVGLRFLREALQLVNSPRGLLFVDDDGRLERLCGEGIPEDATAGAVTRHVAKSGSPLLLQSLGRLPDPAGNGALEPFLEVPSLVAPVRFGTTLLGVLWACGKDDARFFTDDDVSLLRAVSAQLSLYLWGGRALERLRREERESSEARFAEKLGAAYLGAEPVWPDGLTCRTDPLHHSGEVTLEDGRSALWVAGSLRGRGEAAAAASVVRALAEAADGSCRGAWELIEKVHSTLTALEGERGPWHRVAVAAPGEGERVEIAWRGEGLEIAPRSGEGWRPEEVRPGLRRAALTTAGEMDLMASDGSFRLSAAEEV